LDLGEDLDDELTPWRVEDTEARRAANWVIVMDALEPVVGHGA
jgi:hypothetical protein